MEVVEKYAGRGWPLVAADGGADHLLEAGLEPDVIVGDLDSLANPGHWRSDQLLPIREQNTTDFEKCLYSVEAPLLLATGFTGSRFDHSLAALHVMHKYVRSHRVVLISGDDLCMAFDGNLSLDLSVGSRFSVYPLNKTVFVSSTGLKYPLDGLRLESGGMIGTSNQVVHEKIQVTVESGAYCVILPIDKLDSILNQFI